jgi:molybdopterin synthase sulfur carrier subunit
MVVLVKVFANLRKICGGVAVNVEANGDRVIDILEQMVKDFPELEEEIFTPERTLKPFVHVFINGRNIIHIDGLVTRVTGKDQFALFPPVAGG